MDSTPLCKAQFLLYALHVLFLQSNLFKRRLHQLSLSKRLEQPLESDGCDFLADFVADISHFKIGYAITLSQGKSDLYEFWPGLAYEK